MCYAILSVSYRNEKKRVTFECETLAVMNTKISEQEALPQVSGIAVFLCSQIIERVEKWEARPYVQKPEES